MLLKNVVIGVYFFIIRKTARINSGDNMKNELIIDKLLCDRFLTALRSCFPDQCGNFNRDVADKKLKNLNENEILQIERYQKEPSKELLLELLEQCDIYSTEWLLAGKIDNSVCNKIIHYIEKHKLDPATVAKDTGTTKEFFTALSNHSIMPSERFIIRFCAVYSVSPTVFIKNSF